MVDGVNQPKPATQYSTLKLKGKDGKSIDLKNLEGLQKTKGNEALFEKYDKDGNGVIDEKEALVMRNNLQSLAGNGTISKRELSKLFGKDSNAFEALNRLTDQQIAFAQGNTYQEVNGDVTTHLFKDNPADNYIATKKTNGTEYALQDGSKEIRYSDGSREVQTKDGQTRFYNAGSDTPVAIVNADGTSIVQLPDGNTTVMRNADGVLTRTIQLTDDGKEIRTDYETVDGKQITRTYDGIADDAPLTAITVTTQKGGHVVESKFASEEDMKNGKPSEEITDAQNPVLKQITRFAYDDKGNVKAEITDSAGNVTTKFTNSKGEAIPENMFAMVTDQSGVIDGGELAEVVVEAKAPTKAAKTLRQQLQASLGNNYEVGYAKDGSIEVRAKDGTLLADLTEQANATLKACNVTTDVIDGGELAEVVVEAKAPTTAAKNLRQQLQAAFTDYDIGYAKDGSIEVRTKDGTVLAEATRNANAMLATTDSEDINTILSSSDVINKDGQIDKDEYNNFINTMLSSVGFTVNDGNRAQVQELINNSFTSLDTISSDGKITKEELEKNAKEVIRKLTDDINNIDIIQMGDDNNTGRLGDDTYLT